MVEQGDDQLMHFKWKDRTSGNIEDDLIIFPDDVEFKKVNQCTTGRVFLLKFKSTTRKLFFWMQEPKSDKDEEFCKKVNDYLNNPPAPGSSRSGGGGGGGIMGGLPGGLPGNLDFNNLGDNELQSLLNNMDQRQLMQIFGGSLGGGGGGNMSSLSSLLSGAGAGGGSGGSGGRSRQAAGTGNTRQSSDSSSTPAPATPATTVPVPAPAPGGAGGSNPAIQLSDLQSILSNMQVPAGGEGGAAVDLATAMTGEALQPLLQNQEFLDKVKEHLPAGDEGKEVTLADLSGTVQSPQFQQAVSMFSMALGSGQLGPVIKEFGLGDEAAAAAANGDMESFVKALQKKEGGDKKEEKKDEDMALD